MLTVCFGVVSRVFFFLVWLILIVFGLGVWNIVGGVTVVIVPDFYRDNGLGWVRDLFSSREVALFHATSARPLLVPCRRFVLMSPCSGAPRRYLIF